MRYVWPLNRCWSGPRRGGGVILSDSSSEEDQSRRGCGCFQPALNGVHAQAVRRGKPQFNPWASGIGIVVVAFGDGVVGEGLSEVRREEKGEEISSLNKRGQRQEQTRQSGWYRGHSPSDGATCTDKQTSR